MNKTHSILAGLLTIIIWAVLLWLHGKRERNRWLVVDSLTDALRRSNDRVDKEAQKVKQLEAALLDQDKVIKANAEHHGAEMAKLRKEHSAANKAFGERYEEVQKLSRDVEGLRTIIENQRNELKKRDKSISVLEATIDDLRIREMSAIKAGVLAARLVEAIMKDRESTPKAKYKPGGVCSGEKVETEPKEEAKAKQAAEKADEKVPSFLESLIKEMELRNFEPVMAGKITIHSETKKEI